MNLRFLQSRRIKTAKDFEQIWQKRHGNRCSVPLMTIMFKDNSLDYARLGISISKRNIRSAVDRNRLKRLARETFRIRQSELPSQDFVVTTYKGADTLAPKQQYQRYMMLWDQLLKQLKKH